MSAYDTGTPSPAPDSPPVGMPPLGALWRRLVARIIDGILIGIATTVLTVWWVHPQSSSGAVLIGVIGPVLYCAYDALMMEHQGGQTLGKKTMQIRVAMLADGSVPQAQAAWTRAAVFSLPNVISCLGELFSLLNVLWCTWDRPYRQCLHDKAARTVVVSV
jgi:uncharacterized RDD family membrane protein YckC